MMCIPHRAIATRELGLAVVAAPCGPEEDAAR